MEKETLESRYEIREVGEGLEVRAQGEPAQVVNTWEGYSLDVLNNFKE